jgi:hypothetical protein
MEGVSFVVRSDRLRSLIVGGAKFPHGESTRGFDDPMIGELVQRQDADVTGPELAGRFGDLQAAHRVAAQLRVLITDGRSRVHVFPRSEGALVTMPANLVDRHPEVYYLITSNDGVPGWSRPWEVEANDGGPGSLSAWWAAALGRSKRVEAEPESLEIT